MLWIKRITGAADPAAEGEPGSWVSDAAREKFRAGTGTVERMMKRALTLLIAAAVATALAAPAHAEMLQQSKEPTTAEKVEKMTLEQWRKLQAGYKKQKAKYTACNNKAKVEKLRGRKRWGSIYDCMTAG